MTLPGKGRLAAAVTVVGLALGTVTLASPDRGHGPTPTPSSITAGPPATGGPSAVKADVGAVRAGPTCVSDPAWCNPPSPVEQAQADTAGRYRCRNTANVTPCCSMWWQVAADVGWPVDQLAVLDYVMARESQCRPGATGVLVCNASRCARALGLAQLLGWSCPPDGCYDPASNLAKALELWHGSRWASWYLRGDPVTG